MKNICKVIFSLVVIINCNESTIASDYESQIDLQNYNSDNISNISTTIDEIENYTDEDIILDIEDILFDFMSIKLNISNVIQAAHNCNALGWSAYDKQWQKLLEKDKNQFINLLKQNNIQIENNVLFKDILQTLVRLLRPSLNNNTSTFIDTLDFLENIFVNNIEVMQNNIRIVKDTLLMTDIKKLPNRIEKNSGNSYDQLETSIQQKIDKFVHILNKLNNIQMDDNRLKEIKNKLISLTKNILEYLHLTKECLNTIEFENASRIFTTTGMVLIPAILFLGASNPSLLANIQLSSFL